MSNNSIGEVTAPPKRTRVRKPKPAQGEVTAPPSDTQAPVVEPAAVAVSPWPVRWWHRALRLAGGNPAIHHTPDEMTDALDDLGEDPPVTPRANESHAKPYTAIDQPDASDLWLFDAPKLGTVTAVDPQGWWEASMGIDGTYMVRQLVGTNMGNRRPGSISPADHVMQGDNLDVLIARLEAFRDAADPMLNEHAAYAAQQHAFKVAQLDAESKINEDPSLAPGPDPDDVAIAELADRTGMKHGNLTANVQHLCMAWNIPMTVEVPGPPAQDGQPDGTVHKPRDFADLKADVLDKMNDPKAPQL